MFKLVFKLLVTPPPPPPSPAHVPPSICLLSSATPVSSPFDAPAAVQAPGPPHAPTTPFITAIPTLKSRRLKIQTNVDFHSSAVPSRCPLLHLIKEEARKRRGTWRKLMFKITISLWCEFSSWFLWLLLFFLPRVKDPLRLKLERKSVFKDVFDSRAAESWKNVKRMM